ncbi:MAG TPA: magnesium/cobalt transporter CorA [Burkholderiales bacterium]|jgi:magnesium transporter|nr:magnesium/cobalt transporter CorA [Burkholderiales bacterium]
MLVNCVAYQDGKKLADITKHQISDYVGRPDCFVWVALKDPEDAELAEMQEEFGLHPLAVEDARHGHQRPKIEEYGDMVFAVLHVVEQIGEDFRIGEVAVFVGRNYVLSVRSHAERGFTEVRARCEREPELLRHGSGYVLYALMDSVVDRYFPLLDALESELEQIEQRIFSPQTSARTNIEALYYVKQRVMILKHAAGPLLDGAGKLYGGRVPQVCAGLGDYFRDVTDHLVRVNQTIDSVRDMVATAIQVSLATITISESEVTKRLAAYAALVAVPTMVAGVYGMNFEHMPELKWEFGYPFAVWVMVLVDVVLYWRFRRAGWL